MSKNSIWPIYRTLLGAITLSQSEPGSNFNAGVLEIPQSYNTGASLSDAFVSYPGHSFLGASNPSAEMQWVHFTASPDKARIGASVSDTA